MDMFKYICILIILLRWTNGEESLQKVGTSVKPVEFNDTGPESVYKHIHTTVDNATCKLTPNILEIRDEIGSLANAAYKLVKLKVRISGINTTERNIYSTSIYQPRNWVIATSATGKSLLMLREYFEPMSLFTLGFGVANLDIILEQQPVNCLDNVEINQIQALLRHSILNNFGSEAALPDTAEVCNQHIESKGEGEAKPVYICCKNDMTQNGGIQCLENNETIWIHLLFISLYLIQFFIVAYCPLMLPGTLFKARTVFQKYVYKTEPEKSFVLNVQKVDSTESVDESFIKTRQHTCTHMTGFKQHLEGMETGKVYSMYVNAVDLSVRESKIIPDGSVPVGVMNFIFKFFIRCAIRTEIPSVSECCNAKLGKSLSSRLNIRWYQCLRILMLLLTIVVCSSPWILRVWFYYAYEHDVIQQKISLYNALNLTIPGDRSFVSYLSPLHSLFIAIYILLGIEVAVYLLLPDTVKRNLKFTIRKCFRDMRNNSKMEACGFFMSKALSPLTRFGIVGCLVAPFCMVLLPFLVLYLAFNVLPIANLTMRLVINLFYYILRLISPQTFTFVGRNECGSFGRWANKELKKVLVTDSYEQNTRINQFVHATSLFMSLMSICSVLFLTIEYIAFYVECIVYGLVGFILNPKDTMKFVSLGLLLIVYGIDCFGGVRGRYVAYGKAVNAKIQEMVGKRITDVASKCADEQVNTAFRIEKENEDVREKMYLVSGSERYLKWRAPRLVLFLDSSDITYIPKSLLMQMARLQHVFCPGLVHILYLKALLDFSLILMFLIFVFIVIFAFGQAQDISSGGQAIAALGSGFLPLILRKFLFQSHSGPSVDTSNMKWNYLFQNAVVKYNDRWNFEDIQVTCFEEANVQDPSHLNESSAAYPTEIDNDGNENIAFLHRMHGIPKHNIDLKVRTWHRSDGHGELEFYIPKSRAAECSCDELFQTDESEDTVV